MGGRSKGEIPSLNDSFNKFPHKSFFNNLFRERIFLKKNMWYYPRIPTSALKVGFNAFLLHQYWKRHQTYSLFSWLLLLKMPDGKFLNWLLFNRVSNCMIYDDSTKENKNARQKVVTSFLMFWHKGLKYTRFYYKIFHRWSCQNRTKKSLC